MKNSTIKFDEIKPLLKTDNTIQKHLDNLHDLIMYWLTFTQDSPPKNIFYSTLETYHSLRDVLINLKPIEKEYNLYWERKRNDFDNLMLEESKVIDYKAKYEEALKEIEELKELKEANNRLKSLLN